MSLTYRELCSKKVSELKAMAKSKKLKGYSKLRKQQLMDLLMGKKIPRQPRQPRQQKEPKKQEEKKEEKQQKDINNFTKPTGFNKEMMKLIILRKIKKENLIKIFNNIKIHSIKNNDKKFEKEAEIICRDDITDDYIRLKMRNDKNKILAISYKTEKNKNKIMGFMIYEIHYTKDKKTNFITLHLICSNKDDYFRGKQIGELYDWEKQIPVGKLLMYKLFDIAKKLKSNIIRLEAVPKAKSFYQKLGFIEYKPLFAMRYYAYDGPYNYQSPDNLMKKFSWSKNIHSKKI